MIPAASVPVVRIMEGLLQRPPEGGRAHLAGIAAANA